MKSALGAEKNTDTPYVLSGDANDSTPRTLLQNPKKLPVLNILNCVFYVINIVLTYGIGVAGWIGDGTSNAELSLKYQTIVTPNAFAFSIWALISLSQGIFCIVQLLPRFRADPMVLSGVSCWYILVCLAQVGWTFAFAYEQIPLSMGLMAILWIFLISLLWSQYRTPSADTILEFLLLRFPFAVHAGWITAATAVNANVVVVWSGESAGVQLAVGIMSLAVLHAISVWVLFVIEKPNYTVALVLAWANGWIFGELLNPDDIILASFGEDIVEGVKYAAVSVSAVILVQVVVRFIWSLIMRCLRKSGD